MGLSTTKELHIATKNVVLFRYDTRKVDVFSYWTFDTVKQQWKKSLKDEVLKFILALCDQFFSQL